MTNICRSHSLDKMTSLFQKVIGSGGKGDVGESYKTAGKVCLLFLIAQQISVLGHGIAWDSMG